MQSQGAACISFTCCGHNNRIIILHSSRTAPFVTMTLGILLATLLAADIYARTGGGGGGGLPQVVDGSKAAWATVAEAPIPDSFETVESVGGRALTLPAEISDEGAIAAFRRFNERLKLVVSREYRDTDNTTACLPAHQIRTKVATGNHDYPLCYLPEARHGNCTFVSFGVSNADDFSLFMADAFKCRGFALDPSSKSTEIPHYLHKKPNVLFLPFGLPAAKNGPFEKFIEEEKWQMVSLPSLRKFLMAVPPLPGEKRQWDGRIDALKLDCEGCEYSIAESVLREDREFFFHVDQVILELHMPLPFAPTREDAMQIPKLIYLLEEAGLVTQPQPRGRWGACGSIEAAGCAPLFTELGYLRCQGKVHHRICNHLIFYRDDYDKDSYP